MTSQRHSALAIFCNSPDNFAFCKASCDSLRISSWWSVVALIASSVPAWTLRHCPSYPVVESFVALFILCPTPPILYSFCIVSSDCHFYCHWDGAGQFGTLLPHVGTNTSFITSFLLLITSTLASISFYEVGVYQPFIWIHSWMDSEWPSISWEISFDSLTVSMFITPVFFVSTLVRISWLITSICMNSCGYSSNSRSICMNEIISLNRIRFNCIISNHVSRFNDSSVFRFTSKLAMGSSSFVASPWLTDNEV